MMKLVVLVVVGAVLSALGRQDQNAPRCAPATPDIATRVTYVKGLATSSDSIKVATRNMYGLPATTADSVSLVRDEVICTLAAVAYDADLRPEYRVLDRQVFVIKVGSAYLVGDPVHRGPGEWDIVVVFDATFSKVLGRVAG